MKIVFVALRTLSYFTKVNSVTAGGAETQQVVLGRELAKKGFRIFFVTYDEGQEKEIIIDGIKILRSFNPQESLPFLGFVYPNLFRLWECLRKANADIYIQQGAGYITGIIALFCKLYKKQFVFLVGAQRDTDGSFASSYNSSMFSKIQKLRDKKLYKYGLENADLVICQNTNQKNDLTKHHHKNNSLISNGYKIFEYKKDESNLATDGNNIVLWVGHIRPIKRPELFIAIAEAVKNGEFLMIGSFENNVTEKRIRARAQSIPNIEIRGHVPYAEIFRYYEKGSILVNTSISEGFPNTFLEAWLHYMPVVSIGVNPDNILTDFRIGYPCTNVYTAISKIRELLMDKELRNQVGSRGREYVEKYHDIGKKVHEYIEAFEALLEQE